MRWWGVEWWGSGGWWSGTGCLQGCSDVLFRTTLHALPVHRVPFIQSPRHPPAHLQMDKEVNSLKAAMEQSKNDTVK